MRSCPRHLPPCRGGMQQLALSARGSAGGRGTAQSTSSAATSSRRQQHQPLASKEQGLAYQMSLSTEVPFMSCITSAAGCACPRLKKLYSWGYSLCVPSFSSAKNLYRAFLWPSAPVKIFTAAGSTSSSARQAPAWGGQAQAGARRSGGQAGHKRLPEPDTTGD